MTVACCPNCGFDITKDDLVERDGFKLHPREGLGSYLGRSIGLTGSELVLLHTIGQAKRTISREALHNRVSDCETFPEIVGTFVCKIRSKLRTAGVPDPIETVRGKGYRWKSVAA
ncbi:winged helix-turn-helix domain-containing protein [Sphingobium lignivorans]|uniref:DNA-binding response OmpR family regulator n=1 Tax=Sphingobium lignivorans TaxID=2735886 RepID=A0ABR6NFE5_9SPHN|nr:winged helix-turn-helix domain-containing protein [Sphingobium lignivorans]MBB5986012.1 DNA-binding response OmpR family regulator [Sphingobium lignivorans]